MTCRKAREFLSQRGIETEIRDFFKDRLTAAEIRALVGGQDPAAFFSFASPTFKATGLDRTNLSGPQLIDLMAQEPRGTSAARSSWLVGGPFPEQAPGCWSRLWQGRASGGW